MQVNVAIRVGSPRFRLRRNSQLSLRRQPGCASPDARPARGRRGRERRLAARAKIHRPAPILCMAQGQRRGLRTSAFDARMATQRLPKAAEPDNLASAGTDVMRMSAGDYGGRNDCAYPSRLLPSSRCLPSRAVRRATRATRERRAQRATQGRSEKSARRDRKVIRDRWGRQGRRGLPGQSAPPGLRGRKATQAPRGRQGRRAPQEQSARLAPRGRPAMQARSAQRGPLAPPGLKGPKESRARLDLPERLANHRTASSARSAPRGRPDCPAPRAIRVPPGRPGRILFFE